MNINEIFAHDITASNTISGVKLKGVEVEASVFKAKDRIDIYDDKGNVLTAIESVSSTLGSEKELWIGTASTVSRILLSASRGTLTYNPFDVMTDGINAVSIESRKISLSGSNNVVQVDLNNGLHKGSLYVSEAGNFGLFSLTHSNWAVRMNTEGLVFVNQSIAFRNATSGAGIRPTTDNVLACGGVDFKWTKVHTVEGVSKTSDEREKNILDDVSLDEYSDLFMDIKPIAYRWKTGETKRIYFGVGAQTLANQFANHGMDYRNYAIVEYDELEEPTATGQTDRYGMNYQNLQMLTLMQTQKNTRELISVKEWQSETDIEMASMRAQIDTLQIQLEEALLEISNLKSQKGE
jgi:hypothetical protein